MESTINGGCVVVVAKVDVLKAGEGKGAVEGCCAARGNGEVVISPLGIKGVAAAATANEVVEARYVTTDCGCIAVVNTRCRPKIYVDRVGVTGIREGIGPPHGEVAINSGIIVIDSDRVGAGAEINASVDRAAIEGNGVVATATVEVAAQGASTGIKGEGVIAFAEVEAAAQATTGGEGGGVRA